MNRTGQIYTPRSLAAELKVPLRQVLAAIRRGELKCAKFSPATFRVEGEDVDRWLAKLKKS